MKWILEGGRVIDPASHWDGVQNLYISGGKIVGRGGECPEGFVANKVISAAGKWILPGLVDLSARLREPGYEYLATLESEMEAASAGGVTALCCPPDTNPPLDEPGLVEMLVHRASNQQRSHVYPIGALTEQLKGQCLTEMGELSEAGCVSFSQANCPLIDTQVLMRSLQYAGTFGFSVWLYPQDFYLSQGGVAHDGEVATRLGLSGIPVSAEVIAIQTIITLMQKIKVKVHLCRLSTADGVALVRQAQLDGMTLTCDISVQHLHLTEHDVGYFNTHCRLIPPLRTLRDRDALRTGLREGVIQAVVSDHAPLDGDVKQLPFAKAKVGASALELLLPLVVQWAEQENMPLLTAIQKVTTGPAQVMGLDLGRLTVGSSADLCVFDPTCEWSVTPQSLVSQGKNTPFLNTCLQGRVIHTWFGGRLIYSLEQPS